MRFPLIALAVPALCLAQGQPALVLDAEAHDFGAMAPGTVASHRFQLANRGAAALRILRVNTSCGCTSTLVGKDSLEPGQATELEVTFNSAGLQGSVQRTVTVESNDPVRPSLTLRFTAEVQKAVQVEHDTVYLLDLRPGDRRRKSIKLASGTLRPLEVLGVELSEAPWLGVATRQVGDDAYVDLDLLASKLPPDKLSGTDSIELQVSNPVSSVIKLKVHWEKRSPVRASPERVAWSAAAGPAQTAKVALRSSNGKPFRILAVRSSQPALHARVKEGPAALQQSLRLTLEAGVKPGSYDEHVTLTLDSPGHPEFELRVVAALR